MRGDVPIQNEREYNKTAVFPACAGMFLRRRFYAARTGCFPRMRGDVHMFDYH